MGKKFNVTMGNSDTLLKKYIATASALLLIATLVMPDVGLAFAAGNIVFLAVWYLFKKERPGEKCTQWIVRGSLLGAVWVLGYLYMQKTLAIPAGGDYEMTLLYSEILRENIPAFFREVYYGVILGEDKVLPIMFVAPLLHLFGEAHVTYTLLVYGLFVVPFFIVFGMLVNAIQPKCLPFIFAFAPFLSPALCGNLEVCGLLTVAVWLALVYNRTFRKWVPWKGVILGVLTAGVILMDRSYLAFAVGSVLAFLASGGVRFVYDRHFNIKLQAKNMGIIVGTTVLICGLLFGEYFWYSISVIENWTQIGPLFAQNLWAFFSYYGALPILCFGVGLAGLFRKRTRQFTMFLLFQVFFTLLMLSVLEPMDPFQQCMFAPSLFLLAVMGIKALPKWNEKARVAFGVAIMLVFMYTYAPFTGAPLQGLFGTRFAPGVMPQSLTTQK